MFIIISEGRRKIKFYEIYKIIFSEITKCLFLHYYSTIHSHDHLITQEISRSTTQNHM